jgi:hypothetical protein
MEKADKQSGTWTDRHSALAFCVCACVVYCVFFSPVLRYDGILYMAPARSLVIDGNLNTYNESFYYAIPGWNNVSKREITGHRRELLGYVPAPDYTTRGYRYTVFPIGNAFTWLPAVLMSHVAWSGIDRWAPVYANDGFSIPYQMALGWWSFLIGWAGMTAAYRILRFWYRPGESCGGALFVFASGNVIPFMTHDVTFSHSIDFLLINLSVFLFLQILKQPVSTNAGVDINTHVLWGICMGYAAIVRYQDVALLLLPLAYYISYFHRNRTKTWKPLICFVSGCALMSGIQVVYWKILYGSCIISGQLMGVGKLASFDPWEPHMIAMLFSRFHGLYNWMPWLLPVTIGFFLFIRRDKVFGVLFLLIMAMQFYYIASRSEWWNLGFSVRRFSGWMVFFMIGAAEIAALCKKKLYTFCLIFLSVCIVSWAWLFKISYLIRGSVNSIFPRLLGDAGPFLHNNLKPVIPSLQNYLEAFSGLKTWFMQYAWTKDIFRGLHNHSFDTAGIWIVCHIVFICLSVFTVFYLMNGRLPGKNVFVISLSVYILVFYAWMIVSDRVSEDIFVQRIVKNNLMNGFQRIRVRDAACFEGENSILQLSRQPVRFEYPSNGTGINGFWLLGLPGDSGPVESAVKVTLLKTDRRLYSTIVHIGTAGDDRVSELREPWGDTEYLHRWFCFRTDLSEMSDRPDAWELSVIDGKDIAVGAFWYIQD